MLQNDAAIFFMRTGDILLTSHRHLGSRCCSPFRGYQLTHTHGLLNDAVTLLIRPGNTGKLAYDRLNGAREIRQTHVPTHILDMHGTGTKHIDSQRRKCALDESGLSIGRVNPIMAGAYTQSDTCTSSGPG